MSRRRASILSKIQQLVPRSARLLVAASGGRDSMVLLDVLHRSARCLGLYLEVCHIDHGLRSESAAEALFVQRRCEELSVACHIVCLSARPVGANMESWARAERYRAFGGILDERGLELVVTAHNANDVAETLIMRLLANKELNSIDEMDMQRRCLRPLLGVTRQQINEYIATYKVSYVEDPSNADISLIRNRVRHRVVPLLAEEFDPSIVWSLSERAWSLDKDCEALQYIADREVKGLGGMRLNDPLWSHEVAHRLEALPHALQWRVVERLLRSFLGFSLGERRASAAVMVFLGEAPKMQLEGGGEIRNTKAGISVSIQTPPGR